MRCNSGLSRKLIVPTIVTYSIPNPYSSPWGEGREMGVGMVHNSENQRLRKQAEKRILLLGLKET